MSRKLLLVLAFVVIGYATSQCVKVAPAKGPEPRGKVMMVDDDEHLFRPIPGASPIAPTRLTHSVDPALDDDASLGENAADQSIERTVQQLQRELAEKLRNNADAPTKRDVELEQALTKYNADGRLMKIIGELEELVKRSPGTDAANKAATAIKILQVPILPLPADEDFESPRSTPGA